jgi:hypothetical protein
MLFEDAAIARKPTDDAIRNPPHRNLIVTTVTALQISQYE